MQVFLLSTHISILSFCPVHLGPLDAAAQVAEPAGGSEASEPCGLEVVKGPCPPPGDQSFTAKKSDCQPQNDFPPLKS